MKEQRPSQTASFVALARALAHDGFTSAPRFSDPTVSSLLSPGWAVLHSLLSRRFQRMTTERRERATAQLDLIPLRVLAIDAEVEKAVAAGVRQLVILGAGLDTRAFRLASLAQVAVYEVDHPATQSYKRQKAAPLPRQARSLSFVPLNFERDLLGPQLAAAGHRKDEPTVWVWEGVVMYLTDAALRGTLAGISEASAPASRLLVHYHEAERATPRSRERRARKLLLSLWGEPQIGSRAPETMRDEVERAGFEVESDTRPLEWAHRFGANAPAGQTVALTHLLVAHRV